jgi:hypothetical protein
MKKKAKTLLFQSTLFFSWYVNWLSHTGRQTPKTRRVNGQMKTVLLTNLDGEVNM